jgi:hypothetical protein
VRTKSEFKGTFGRYRYRYRLKDSVRVELGKTGCPDIKLLNMAQGGFYWLELGKEH